MKKKTTIVDIATELGITPSAVSKAFSGHPRISLETKKAVREVANKLGYKANALATGLRKGKSGLIGILVPGIHYSFFAAAIDGAEEVLSQHGYNVIITQSKDNFDTEKKQLEGLLNAQVEGLIASVAMSSKDYLHFRSLSNTPLILFDRTFEDGDISTVTIDDFGGAVKAVDHLIEMGYSRIAHIGGYEHVLPFGRRIEGYKSALLNHGLQVRENFIHQCAPSKEEGAKATDQLFALSEPPDAIFAASDYLALGAIKVIKGKNLRVPEDVGIVGFSNEEFSSDVSPTITTIDQYSELLGATAAKSLIDQLNLSSEANFVAQRHILSPTLIIRESSVRKNTMSIL
jgi:LacI family transcriptional regulator